MHKFVVRHIYLMCQKKKCHLIPKGETEREFLD